MLPYSKKPEPSYREMKAFFLKPNRSTVAVDRHENQRAIQSLAIGLIVGIGIRIAWDLGIISSGMFVLNDAAATIWIMLCDLWTACSGHIKALFAS